MKIYAWSEMYVTKDTSDKYVDDCTSWSQLVDGLVLSLDIGAPDALEQFSNVVRRLSPHAEEIIPGIKTSPFIRADGFESPKGWVECEKCAKVIDKILGRRKRGVILLNNESALTNNPGPIVGETLGESLECFGRRKLLWYPGMTGATRTERLRYRDIAWWAGKTKGTADTTFIDLAISRRISMTTDSTGAIEMRRLLQSATVNPVIVMLYMIKPTDGSLPYWQADELPYAVEYVRRVYPDTTTMILYPGGRDWGQCAREVQLAQSRQWFGLDRETGE